MRTIYTLALLAMLIPASAQAYIFSSNFNSGNLPRTMTTTNEAGLTPIAADYRYGYTEKGWCVDQVYGDGYAYAALCPTHTLSKEPSRSVLSLPALTIEGDAPILCWEAMSMIPGMGESYSVTVTEGTAEPQTIFTIDEEAETWRTRAVDLSAYKGKEVVISFICTSINKYMLALDNIMVGDPEDTYTAVYDLSNPLVAYGDGHASVSGVAGNYGKAIGATSLALYSGSEKVDEMEITSPWTAGVEIPFSLSLPVTLNEQTPYKVVAEGEGVSITLQEGNLYATSYQRHLLIDEGTALWCNNCPDGLLNVQALERTYGESVICLSSHIRDILACEDYNKALSFFSIPRLVLNRNRNSEADSDKKFGPYLFEPTDMCIDVTEYTYEGDVMNVNVAVRSAKDLDNSSDRYRVGYTITTDFISTAPDPRFIQDNMGGGVVKRQFHFLPSKIPAELNPMKGVVITADNAFDGFPGSLQGEFKADEPMEFSWDVTLPDLLSNWAAGRVVAYIIDTETGHVVNSTAALLNNPTTSICRPSIEEDADAPTEYFTIDGLRVSNPGKGLYIMRRGSKVSKIIL